MRIVLVAMMLLMVLGLVGCASVNVNSAYDPGTKFDTYDTYNWIETPAQNPTNQNPPVAENIQTAVNLELESKGYSVDPVSPDFLVALHAANRSVNVQSWGYFTRRPWYRNAAEVQKIKDGTLIIDIIDAKSKEMVWRGTAVGVMDGDFVNRDQQVEQVIDQVMANFPPQPVEK